MKVSVITPSPSERILEVIVDASAVEKAYKQAFREKQKNLKLKGFRKGNVPESLAKQYLTDAHLVRRVINIVVPPAYKEALKEQKLSPLGKPDWHLKQSERGKELIFEARLQVLPILEIKGYRGFPIHKPASKVTDEVVESAVQQRRQSAASYVTLPDGHQARFGDFAFIDYKTRHHGRLVPQGEVRNFLLEMKPEKFLPGFVDRLAGAKASEERRFSLTLPLNYADRRLAGEQVDFEVKVHQLKERQVPSLNDEFARKYTKSPDLATLRQNIRTNLEMMEERRFEEEISNSIVKSLVATIDPNSVPPQLQEGHAQLAWRAHSKNLERQGTTMEQYLSGRGITSDHFAEELRLTGLVEARLEILYRSIAAAENIVVFKKEVDQAIETQATTAGGNARQLKEQMLKDDTYKLLAYRILIGKVRKRLYELAEVVEVDTKPAAAKKRAESNGKSKASKKTPASKAKTVSAKKSPAKSKAKGSKKATIKKAKPKPKAKTAKRVKG